jgi:hypothetical protein
VSNYYTRTSSTNSDGTPLFATQADNASQAAVAEMIERSFGPGLQVKQFGHLCPIDYYAERDGRMAAAIEIKCRSHDSLAYPTVFLNVRKWLAMKMASVGLGVPAFFVVRFTDQVLYVNIDDIDASKQRIGGTSRIVKSKSDREPVIEVPIAGMQCLSNLPSPSPSSH